mgnify:CR=1 FL=1
MARTQSLSDKNATTGHVELCVRFALWADSLQQPPTPEQIVSRFSVSYATSYRWRNAYYAAKGYPPPNAGPH